MAIRRLFADTCFVLFSTVLWAAATLLGCLGLLPLAALLACGADASALAAQLAGLGQHYLAAPPPARATFDIDVALLGSAVFALALLARLPLLIARLRTQLTQGEAK